MEEKIAIVDLGSNSIRMIIMKLYEDNSYKMIDQAKDMVRLSEGMAEKNLLKPIAIQRTLSALKIFRKLIEFHKVDQTFAIATAAVRNADNRRFFLDKVRFETGFDFEVAPGEQEAYYDYLGVINTIAIENCVIIDTGGGSTEFVLVEGRKIKEAISIPYGAVVLTEKFLANDEISKDNLKKLEEFMKEQLKDIGWLDKAVGLPVIGLGGSIRTLAKIQKKKASNFIEGMHNYHMDAEDVYQIYDKITSLKMNERKDIPGLGKDRADIITGGLVPVRILMELLRSDKLIISGNGLREGVFFKNYLELCGLKDDIVEDVLSHSIDNILKNYDSNVVHCNHVSKLSLEMFDQMKELHGLGNEYRKVLEVGSMLHDIGQYVDYYNHHKHGFYLTLNSRINGLTHRELVICAYIVAMHRNDEFKQDWKDYSQYIDKYDYEAIKKLAMFVRITEELDRNEYGSVIDIQCEVGEDSVEMFLKTKRAADLEIAVAMQSDKAFEKVFGKSLYIV